MNIKFRVHNVSDAEETRTVKLNGSDIAARVPCTMVELVTETGQSLTLPFIGAEIAAEAKKAFVKDEDVYAEFGPGALALGAGARAVEKADARRG